MVYTFYRKCLYQVIQKYGCGSYLSIPNKIWHMICLIWKDLFHKSLEWLQVHTTTVLWCLWCRWFCDMRDDEETTWIEKWATLLNTSKHEFLKKKTTFAIHHHPITIIILIMIMHIKTYALTPKHTKTAVNEEWKIDLTAFSISYSHFWTIRTPQEKINKNAQENDEERRGAAKFNHTYIRTNMKTSTSVDDDVDDDDCTNN